MLVVLAIILGLFLSTVVIFIIDMEDVHAGRTNTDCCLSFKQFKSFYSLNPEKWHVGSNCLGYDAHGFAFALKVRFRSWFDVLRYYFFAKRVKKKKRMDQANQNTLLVIQEIQKDIDHVKQQSKDQIEHGRRRFVELWEQFRETHDTINENEALEILSQKICRADYDVFRGRRR